MDAGNVIRDSRNLSIMVIAVVSVMTLLVFSSAVVEIRRPIDSGFGGPGYVYSIEYECGTQTNENNSKAQPGKYSTNILIHNPFAEEQNVFIKILPITGKPIASEWLNKTSTIMVPWTITADGALNIDCEDITKVVEDTTSSNPCCPVSQPQIFSKGLLIISHPVPGDGTKVLIEQPLFGDESLDVTASYTYFSSEDAIKKKFVKCKVNVKKTNPDRTVTNIPYELIIGVDSTAPLVNLKDKVKQALSDKGVSDDFKIVEVAYVNPPVGGGGIGVSKDVETIKGKLVPFVPVPEEIIFFIT